MKKNIRKVAVMLLVLVVIGCVSPVMAATKARTGSTSYCTVNISQALLNKSGKQYATVKLKTLDYLGWYNTGKKVRVTLTDNYGRYITSWTAKGGDTLKLGDDHKSYRIYVDYYEKPTNGGFWSSVLNAGSNWTNAGGSYEWSISNAKNCSIY